MDFLKNGRSTIREDPEDGECKETIKNAKKTLEISMTKESNKIKNRAWMHRGSAWIHEKAFGNYSTERSWRSHRGKRVQINKSLQFGAQVFPMPQARKILGAKAATKNERSSKSCQRGNWTKWRAKKDVSLEAPSKSPCCFIDGHLSSRKYWRPRSACCIHRARFVCVSNGSCDSNGYHCRTVRLAADVVAASKQLKDSPRLLRIVKSECPGVYVFHDTNGQNHRQTLKTLNEIWSSIIRIAVWKTVRRSSIVIWIGKSIELGMSPRMTLVSTRGWHQNDWRTAEFGSHGMMKNVDLDESISFLDQRECKPTEISVKEQQKNCQRGRNITQKLSRGFTIWKDMRKSALRGIVS